MGSSANDGFRKWDFVAQAYTCAYISTTNHGRGCHCIWVESLVVAVLDFWKVVVEIHPASPKHVLIQDMGDISDPGQRC